MSDSPFTEFESLLNKLQSEDAPETVYDDLLSLHKLTVEGSRATLAEKQAELEAKESEILSLKARNHDMLLQLPGTNAEEPEPEDDQDEEPGSGGIDALFSYFRRGER